MSTLLNKTGNKKIVECTNDRLWGMGIPLNKAECLDQSKWTGQGILGEILEEICHEFRPSMPTVPPPSFDGVSTYFNSTTPFIGAPGISHHQQMPFNIAAWNTPCQLLPVHTPLTGLDCGHSTANALQATANMGPPTTCVSADHTKHPTNPTNMETIANLATNNNNPELEHVSTLQIESAPQNEVEMTESSPT